MDEQRKKKYEYPPISLLKEDKIDLLKEDENAEAVEKCFYYLENSFDDALVERDLIGVRVCYNQTVLRYRVFGYAATNYSTLFSLCQEIAYKDPQEYLKGKRFDYSLNSDKTNHAKGEITYSIPHVNLKVPSLKRTTGEKKSSDGEITATFFANIFGVPEWVDLSDKSIVLLSDSDSQQKEKLLSSTLINLTYRYSPDEVKFIFLGKSNEYADCFSGIPHLEFQKPFEKFEQIYSCLEWLKKIKDERKEFLKSKGFENICAYNAVNDKKLPHYVVILSDYKEVCYFYGAYIERFETLLKDIFNNEDKLGFSIIITANNGLNDGFDTEIRTCSALKITFKTPNAMASFRAIGKAGAERLLYPEQIMITEEQLIPNQMLSYEISKEEIKAVCDYLKGENLSEFNEEDYKWICEQAESGPMNEKNREKTKEECLLKEIVRMTIKFGSVTVQFFRARFKVEMNVLLKAIECAIENKYIVCERVNYKAKITAEEFEKIFGEKL